MEWMQEAGYVNRQMVSIYIENFNGRNPTKAIANKNKYDLPDSYLRFGDYDAQDIVKGGQVYFWNVTSQYNWTLDFYALQYGSVVYDLQASDGGSFEWKDDIHDEDQNPDEQQVIKAHFNPSTPFIALPNILFKKLAALWLEGLDESYNAFCSDQFCMARVSCTKLLMVKDIGIKLGSLNDTRDYLAKKEE